MTVATGAISSVNEDGWALPRPMSCFNCQEPLIGRPKSKNRGPDCAWVGQCARCTEVIDGQMEVIRIGPMASSSRFSAVPGAGLHAHVALVGRRAATSVTTNGRRQCG